MALTAVGRQASPGTPLKLTDPNCVNATPAVPTCGVFDLGEGANGAVTMSSAPCEGIADCREVGSIQGLVVTTVADLKDLAGDPLYSKTNPVRFIVKCDKTLCPVAA